MTENCIHSLSPRREPQYMVLLSDIIKKDDKVLSKQMRELKKQTLEEIKNNDYQFEDVIIEA